MGRTFLLLALVLAGRVEAAPGPAPAGYTLTMISGAIPDSLIEGISQLAFKPGDPNHLFAVQSDRGKIVRYDYSANGTLTNPLVVKSGLTIPIGIAFRGAELYVSTNADNDGRILRLRDLNSDGVFEERVDFVRGVPVREHYVDQLQIRGNMLYAPIGTRTNGGVPSCERIYCGVIARVADLTQVNFNGVANALPDSATFVNPLPVDGFLRRYAWGFRNPFGIRVDALGQVWASDNGASLCTTCSTCNRFAIDTADYFYGPIPQGARGVFPPAGFPGGGGATMTPLTDLGFHPAVAGFDWIATGPDASKILLTEFGPTDPLPIGKDIVKIDPGTGAKSSFITGFDGPTDLVADLSGRLVISDYLTPAIYLLTPPATVSVPVVEPSSARRLAPRIERVAPNPIAGETSLEFSLARESFVTVTVHDLGGRAITTLTESRRSAGPHSVTWNGNDRLGRSAAPGVYLCRVTTTDGVAVARLVRL
jgi:FlgD Ig-like domain